MRNWWDIALEQIEKERSDLLSLRKNNLDIPASGGTPPTIQIEGNGTSTSSCCKPELGYAPNVSAFQMMSKILEDSALHPNDALANIPLIPDSMGLVKSLAERNQDNLVPLSHLRIMKIGRDRGV